MYVLRKGLYLKSYDLRMGLEPEKSYSREGSGFLGLCGCILPKAFLGETSSGNKKSDGKRTSASVHVFIGVLKKYQSWDNRMGIVYLAYIHDWLIIMIIFW